MEAASIRIGVSASRLPAPAVRMRFCSDEQLIERYRAGRDEAFGVIHERYRACLMAYVRQMLSRRSSEDVEDVLQEIFMRAATTLRTGGVPSGLRPWLYSVAHNRCIDELRRRPPAPRDDFAMSRPPPSDTSAVVERRADVERLFRDLRALPELQRSALLMRELQGLTHAELATALDATVPSVKSLLVRARVGLVDAEEARGAPCASIRDDLADAHDRRVKANAQASRHLRECAACSAYRAELRGTSRRVAALAPGPAFLPFALLRRLFGGSAIQAEVPAATTGLATSGAATIGIGKVAAMLSLVAVATTGVVLDRAGIMRLPWASRSVTPSRLGPSILPGTRISAHLSVPGGSSGASAAPATNASASIDATATPSSPAASTPVPGGATSPGGPSQQHAAGANSAPSSPGAAGRLAKSAPTQAGGSGTALGGGNPVPRRSSESIDKTLSGAASTPGDVVQPAGKLSETVAGTVPVVAGAVSGVAGAVSTAGGGVGAGVSNLTAGAPGAASTPTSLGSSDSGPVAGVTGAASNAAGGIEVNG